MDAGLNTASDSNPVESSNLSTDLEGFGKGLSLKVDKSTFDESTGAEKGKGNGVCNVATEGFDAKAGKF